MELPGTGTTGAVLQLLPGSSVPTGSCHDCCPNTSVIWVSVVRICDGDKTFFSVIGDSGLYYMRAVLPSFLSYLLPPPALGK